MTTSTTQLHVWEINDGERHLVIAESAGRAFEIAVDHDMLEDASKSGDYSIKQLDDETVLSVRDDDGSRETKTCEEWVKSEGRCFLSSTCY